MKNFLIVAFSLVILAEFVWGKDAHIGQDSSNGTEPKSNTHKRSLYVLNASPPDSITNFGPVDTIGGSGIRVLNGKVGTQANIAMESSRKKRFIDQHIGYVNKQINISKRNVTDNVETGKEMGKGKSKRWTERIGSVNKQINVDMGH